MKTTSSVSSFLLTAALTLVAYIPSARAQIPWATEPFSRLNKLEVYGIGQYLHQGNTTINDSYSPGGSYKLKLGDTGLGGVGVAYHFSDFFSVHGDFLFGPATFTAEDQRGNSYSLGNNGFLQTGRINLDYNIINRRLSPFITAGIGYQYLQVEQDYYYYDPYYGGNYYYSGYYSESDFTWNVGAGIRWNITDNLFIKLTGGAQWLEYQNAQSVTTQIEAIFAIGWTFP